MAKPKSTENKAKDVETSSKRAQLKEELGDLTYKIAVCNTQIAKVQERREPLLKRSNEIVNELERLGNG